MADCTELGEKVALIALSLAGEPQFDTLDAVTAEVQRIVGVTPQQTVEALVAFQRMKKKRAVSEASKRIARINREAGATQALKNTLEELENEIKTKEWTEAPAKLERRISESVAKLRAERNLLKRKKADGSPAKPAPK